MLLTKHKSSREIEKQAQMQGSFRLLGVIWMSLEEVKTSGIGVSSCGMIF
jgi:hypothetical protein